ncbi:MAG TPA: glycosyltransferase [Ktedonobacterales bacterium]|nr:glycosyltransferase [Ktedonobacterales bacterium]
MRGRSWTARRVYGAAGPWAQALIVAGAGALSLARYRRLPDVRSAPTVEPQGAEWPLVSIIVPARNEERNLPALLASLLAQDYPAFEVIVVDDASTDETGALADAYAERDRRRLSVIHGAGPAPGWTGKSAACWLGARVARGAWLLFTDADTRHEPGALRAAMALARAAHVEAVSLFPRQRCETFWERLLLPFAYQQYFVGVRTGSLGQVEAPALANGQYFLISRRAYDAAGGHAAVAASVIEDVALAGALKRAGYPALMARGEAQVSVRMYGSLGALVEGFTKNAAQFLRAQRSSGALVGISCAASAATLPALVRALATRNPMGAAGALAAWVAQVVALAPWMRGFGTPRRYAALGPLAALAFTGVALSSFAHALLRWPVRWKGRPYAPRS